MVLKLRYPPPDNWKDAKCKDTPLSQEYDPFFGIEYDVNGFPVDEEEAKSHAVAFCNGDYDGVTCPVRHECLLFALTNNAKEGVWGGTTEVTRKAIRKKFPALKNGKPRKEWKWTTQESALEGLSKKKIEEELTLEILAEEG